MSKEELLQFEGLVTEIFPDARYRIRLDNGHQLVDFAPIAGGVMRSFIFKSEASPGLGAFCGDLAGLQLPRQFTPWRAVGVVAPDRDPPYKLSCDVI